MVVENVPLNNNVSEEQISIRGIIYDGRMQ